MFSTLLSDSFIFFRNHFSAIAAIILPIIIPFEIFSALYQHLIASDGYALADQLILMIIGLMIYPIYAGGLVFFIVSVLRREPIDNNTAWRMAWANWSRYLLVTVMITVAVMFGLSLLIVPGIILGARLAFSEFEVLLGGNDPVTAISKSWQLTREYMWYLAGGFILFTVALYAPYILLEYISSPDSPLYWATSSVLNVLVALFGALYTVFAFRIYDLVKPQTPPETE
ncbi:hypothetical protein ACFOZ5_07370 [Marinobacter lacisalsi]|uniref:DUF7847 domain-containing protein n=1 Tax=Marinobacter lacisalsi TaxID=475979 RepID=A0ABV8QGS8_9GAMM